MTENEINFIIESDNKDLIIAITMYETVKGCLQWWKEELVAFDKDGNEIKDVTIGPKNSNVILDNYVKPRLKKLNILK